MFKTAEELRKERDRMLMRVYNLDNKYGYKLNVNNPVLKQWYLAYMRKNGIHIPPPDKERLEWEKKAHKYIKCKYKEIYHDDLREPVIGWTEQRVEELVKILGGNDYKP